MGPVLSTVDSANQGLPHAKGFRYLSLASPVRLGKLAFDCLDLLLRQFRVWIQNSWLLAKPAFSNAVMHVLFLSPPEKMCWIAAGRIIACMANTQLTRVFTSRYSPCDPIGLVVSPAPIALKPSSPVSACASPHPWPALIRFLNIDFRPKALKLLRPESWDSSILSLGHFASSLGDAVRAVRTPIRIAQLENYITGASI